MVDPTGGWAEAGAELIKGARDLGALIAPPFRELIGMSADQVGFWRVERRVRLAEQCQEFMRERGLEHATRNVAPSFMLSLLEAASIEDDDDLQDIWARMLANAADGNSSEPRTAFIGMLREMTAFDVQNLAKIAAVEPRPGSDGYVWVNGLPDILEQGPGQLLEPPRKDVAISMANLGRLGCLLGSATYAGPINYSQVMLTELGRAFVAACTG